MLKRYAEFLSDATMSELRYKGARLSDKDILMVNTAKDGGGVAQVLKSLIPLLRDVDVSVDWRVMREDEAFFDITKRLHNGLQGESINLTDRDKNRYLEGNEAFWESAEDDYDLIFIHDPQPCAVIDHIDDTPSILRLHIDSSSPDESAWQFLKPYISQYDEVVVSKQDYYHEGINAKTRVFQPATDPFSPINQSMSSTRVNAVLQSRVGETKHLISQVSRFDKWKDPIGVIDVFERVREEGQASLLLLGSDAEDDPEGQEVYEAVCERKAQSPYEDDITVVMENNAELVNAAQRGSDVVVQKSLREGFGLTVSEAMLKGTPVVASNVGGIPCQVTHGETGFLHDPRSTEAFASTILNLLEDEAMQDLIGSNAAAHVKQNFLMTRLLDDYLDLFHDHLVPGNTS